MQFVDRIHKMFMNSLAADIPSHTKEAIFHTYGNPEDVITIEEVPMPKSLEKTQVLLKTLAANVNPSDLFLIRGFFGSEPSLPGFPGFDGVSEIIKVGDEVKEVAIGDWVIGSGISTWREYTIVEASKVIRINKSVGLEFAAGVVVNPCAAYRMIKDFLPEGKKVIIQNGASSSVGVYVIQMAREWGLKTINVIRTREDERQHDELVERLKSYGADLVVTHEEAQDTSKFKIMIEEAGLELPALALDCVGGPASLVLSKALQPKGFLVNYGKMSGEDVAIDVGSLIGNDIEIKGFRLGRWMEEADAKEKIGMISEVVELAAAGKLLNTYEKFSFHKDLHAALKRACDPMRSAKVILTFDDKA